MPPPRAPWRAGPAAPWKVRRAAAESMERRVTSTLRGASERRADGEASDDSWGDGWKGEQNVSTGTERPMRGAETIEKFEVLCADGRWLPYDATANAALAQARQEGRASCKLYLSGWSYVVDFERMVQRNVSTRHVPQTERPVRVVEAGAETTPVPRRDDAKRKKASAPARLPGPGDEGAEVGEEEEQEDEAESPLSPADEKFEVRCANRLWLPYDATASARLAQARQEGRTSCNLDFDGWSYVVDFERMVQRNVKTRTERPVRVVEGGAKTALVPKQEDARQKTAPPPARLPRPSDEASEEGEEEEQEDEPDSLLSPAEPEDDLTAEEEKAGEAIPRCSTPGCDFRAHSDPNMGDTCCRRCPSGSHGPRCEGIAFRFIARAKTKAARPVSPVRQPPEAKKLPVRKPRVENANEGARSQRRTQAGVTKRLADLRIDEEPVSSGRKRIKRAVPDASGSVPRPVAVDRGEEKRMSAGKQTDVVRQKPLARGWTECWSDEFGIPFYWHEVRKVAVWDRPVLRSLSEVDAKAGLRRLVLNRCVNEEDCVGTKNDGLVRHLVGDALKDVYCESCFEAAQAKDPTLRCVDWRAARPCQRSAPSGTLDRPNRKGGGPRGRDGQ